MVETVIIDQRDIQSKGGIYSKYPASYIISLFLQKYSLRKVLDVTYGRGRFYKIRKPELLVGADIRIWDWEVVPDLFIARPVWAVKQILDKAGLRDFDIIIVDPPFPRGEHSRREEYNNLFGTPDIIISSAVKLAKDLGISRILVHYNKLLDLNIEENIEFHFIARTLNINEGKNNISYFTLYSIK